MHNHEEAQDYLREELRINPPHIQKGITITDLIDNCYTAFNARSFRQACQLFARKIAQDNVRIGLSVAGALVPAGIGQSTIIPMIENGLVDWIVSTGANLYHDIHSQVGFEMYMGNWQANDCELFDSGIIRIHDIFFHKDALYETDSYIRGLLSKIKDSCKNSPLATSVLHNLIGKDLVERNSNAPQRSILAAACKYDIPIYTSSPGDSSIGLNAAELTLRNTPFHIDTLKDVIETAALVYDAKANGGKSAVIILGGGSPKNFALQTEPMIREILMLEDTGHDYFIQFTDARIDSGGLSGATPSEAVTWGKVDPAQLPDTIVCYGDVSCYYPLFIAYALNKGCKRRHSHIYANMEKMVKSMSDKYLASNR